MMAAKKTSPYSITGICNMCGEQTLIRPVAKYCEDCQREKHNAQILDAYHEKMQDPLYREKINTSSRIAWKKRMEDLEYREEYYKKERAYNKKRRAAASKAKQEKNNIMQDVCPNCGGSLIGDGYTMVLRCEFVEEILNLEPDGDPVYCKTEYDDEKVKGDNE